MHIIVPNYLFAIDRMFIVRDMDRRKFESTNSYVRPIKCHITVGREFRECVAYFDHSMLQAIVASVHY